jgi:hypothetical protein
VYNKHIKDKRGDRDMTDFEMIKQIYINKKIDAYITDISDTVDFGLLMIEDFENEITYWFNRDGSLDFITNDKETQSW